MNDPTNGLPVPAAVTSAERTMELLRVWIADGDQIVTITPNLWKDPAAWGLMLVDLVKHVAEAYAAQGLDPQATRIRIREAMEAEWSSPTDSTN